MNNERNSAPVERWVRRDTIMHRKPIEQFNIGQHVESTGLRESGKIVKIMPRKKVVQIEYWTQRGNKKNLVEIPFGSIFNVKNIDGFVYGLSPNVEFSGDAPLHGTASAGTQD